MKNSKYIEATGIKYGGFFLNISTIIRDNK